MPGLARPSAGEHLPRPLTRCYGRLTQALRRPVEPAQYACTDYRAILARHGIVQSMSRKGDCWDNAPMESLFGSLKTEGSPALCVGGAGWTGVWTGRGGPHRTGHERAL